VLLLGSPSALPQALGSTGSPSSDTSTPPPTRQEQPSFTEVLGSVGRFLTDGLRGALGGRAAQEVQWDSNQDPRSAIFTFVTGMEDLLYNGGTDRARVDKTLPEGFDSTSGEAVALKSIFDRLGSIPETALPGAAAVERSNLKTFELFPYAVDHEWVWLFLDTAPKQKITLELDDSDGTWRFSEDTMRSVIELAETMAPIPPLFPSSADTQIVRRIVAPMFGSSPWWSWLLLVLSVLVAFLAGRGVRRGLLAIGNRADARSALNLALVLKGLATSLGILTGTIIIIAGSSFVSFPPVISEAVWTLVRTVLLVAFIWAMFAFTELGAKLIRGQFIDDSNDYGEMAVAVVQRCISALLAIILIIFILENVLGLHISALVTGLGIIGLALSLAGKETTQNLFGAVSIFTNRPFVIGDWISFKGEIGSIVDVKMQATHVRLITGEMLVVPNMQFVSHEVENLSMRRYLRREINLSVTYETPKEKLDEALRVLEEVLRSDEVVSEGHCRLEERPPFVAFTEFGEYSLKLRAYYWYFIGEDGSELQRTAERGWYTYLAHCSLVNQAILREFNERNIDFAFPTETVKLESPA